MLSNMATGGVTPSVSSQLLAELGYKLVIYPAIAMMAAIRAIETRLQLLLESGLDQAVDADDAPIPIFRKMGLDFWQEIERKYQ
jgi:2,3-dimethylmalate lyase